MTTLRTINKALADAGIDAVLRKGPGYFYFEGPECEGWYTPSVNVYRLNQLTTESWVRAYLELKAQENDRNA